jgi:hypothetical protein
VRCSGLQEATSSGVGGYRQGIPAVTLLFTASRLNLYFLTYSANNEIEPIIILIKNKIYNLNKYIKIKK